METRTLLAVILLAFANIVIVFFMTNNFCGFKSSVALKKVKIIPTIIIAIAYTIIYILTLELLPDRVQHHFNFLPLMVLTWLFVERKKVSFALDETALIWLLLKAIIYLLIAIPIAMSPFITDELIRASLTFILASIATIFICQKLDFNKFLVFILRRTTFRILIFLSVMLYLVITIVLQDRTLVEDGIRILTLYVPSFIGFIYTLRLTHQSVAVVPDAYHDAKKLLMLLDIKSEEATDFGQLNAMLAQSVDLMNLQLPAYDLEISNTNTVNADFEKLLIRTIESVKIDKKTNTQVIPNIQFFEKHHEVDDIKIAYMIGLLLDHAFDTLTKRPIFVDVTSARYNALIRISCEYKFEKGLKRLEKFLLDNENIRSSIKKNFNLSKLKSIVDKHDGKLVVAREKNTQEQIDYLSICIIFKKEGDSLG